MDDIYRQKLIIDVDRLNALNSILLNPDMRVINDFFKVVDKYGTPEEINKKAEEAASLKIC